MTHNRCGGAKSMAMGGMGRQGNACIPRDAQPIHKISPQWVPRYRANCHKRRSRDQQLHRRGPHARRGVSIATPFLGQPQPRTHSPRVAQPVQPSSPPSLHAPLLHWVNASSCHPELANSAIGPSILRSGVKVVYACNLTYKPLALKKLRRSKSEQQREEIAK